MGSQQLLLVVLSMVVIGIALTIAITLFQSNAIESNRSAMTDDLLYFATRARDYYWRPKSLGGGDKSFAGLTSLKMLSGMIENDNGSYSITPVPPAKDELIIVGIGKVIADDNPTQVRIIINEQSNTIQIVN